MENKYYGMRCSGMSRSMNRAGNCRFGCQAIEAAPVSVECTPDGQPMVVGMAYVPMQVLNTVYEPEMGFRQGTIFPELDKPWLAGGVNCG